MGVRGHAPHAPIKELATLERGDRLDEVTLVKALRAAGDASVDTQELSWQALAHFVAETHFVHVWNLATNMRFTLGLPTNDYLEVVQLFVAEHPFREYLEMASRSRNVMSRSLAGIQRFSCH